MTTYAQLTAAPVPDVDGADLTAPPCTPHTPAGARPDKNLFTRPALDGVGSALLPIGADETPIAIRIQTRDDAVAVLADGREIARVATWREGARVDLILAHPSTGDRIIGLEPDITGRRLNDSAGDAHRQLEELIDSESNDHGIAAAAHALIEAERLVRQHQAAVNAGARTEDPSDG